MWYQGPLPINRVLYHSLTVSPDQESITQSIYLTPSSSLQVFYCIRCSRVKLYIIQYIPIKYISAMRSCCCPNILANQESMAKGSIYRCWFLTIKDNVMTIDWLTKNIIAQMPSIGGEGVMAMNPFLILNEQLDMWTTTHASWPSWRISARI